MTPIGRFLSEQAARGTSHPAIKLDHQGLADLRRLARRPGSDFGVPYPAPRGPIWAGFAGPGWQTRLIGAFFGARCLWADWLGVPGRADIDWRGGPGEEPDQVATRRMATWLEVG